MRDYRNGLDQIAADWKFGAVTSRLMNVDRDMLVYESIWSAFAQTGVIDGAPDAAYAEKYFGLMAPEMREAVCALLGGLDVRAWMLVETTARLRSLGIEPHSANMAVATALVLQARAEAAKGLRLGMPAPDDVRPTEPETPEILPTVLPPHHIPEKWRFLTPVEAAELMIASNPSMFEHRKDGKRAESLVGEQTFRQIRWAAALLQKSMNPEGPSKGTRPLWTLTTADIVLLDKWFDRLPATCGKSPWDREPETTLALHSVSNLDTKPLHLIRIEFKNGFPKK